MMWHLSFGPKENLSCLFRRDATLSADSLDPEFDFDVVGHYACPDVFRLEINEQTMNPVVFDNRGH